MENEPIEMGTTEKACTGIRSRPIQQAGSSYDLLDRLDLDSVTQFSDKDSAKQDKWGQSKFFENVK